MKDLWLSSDISNLRFAYHIGDGKTATYPIHTHTGFTTVNLFSVIDSPPQKEIHVEERAVDEVIQLQR